MQKEEEKEDGELIREGESKEKKGYGKDVRMDAGKRRKSMER